MQILDYGVIGIYFLSLIGIGIVFAKSNKTISGMFLAARQSPWWLSGISSYMMMFSAGTFVVWGGITYEYGLVGILICCVYGISAFIVGKFIAGRWHETNLNSGAEFVELRYGKGAFHFYTWYGLLMFFNSGMAVYGLAVMLCPLIVLPSGHFLADPLTGNLALSAACIIISMIIIGYTMIGGIWAVLVTDLLQFFVLTTSVILTMPLIIRLGGGYVNVINNLPEGFLRPTAPGFSGAFLVGWMLTNMFFLGAQWQYIQKHLCVPTAKDAQKAMYLFGVLYLFTPILWMLPPFVYRTINSNANPEQAYILACKTVLPAGLIGLLMAAMFSATASSLASQLNVFSGVITEFYQKKFKPEAKQYELIIIGRLLTFLIGLYMLGGALILPMFASYRGVVITMGSILGPPLTLPTLFGLFWGKMGKNIIWQTVLIGGGLGFLQKIAFTPGGWLSQIKSVAPISEFVNNNYRAFDSFFSITIVSLIILYAQLNGKERPEWRNLLAVVKARATVIKTDSSKMSSFPALVIGYCLFGLAAIIGILGILNNQERVLLLFAATILSILGFLFRFKLSKNIVSNDES